MDDPSILSRLVRRLKALLPRAISQTGRAAYYPCFRAILAVRCRYADARHVRPAQTAGHMPIPPALLRYRVSESTDPGLFLAVEPLAKFRDQSVREAAVLIVLSTLQCKPEPFPLQGPEIHAFRHAATEAPSVPRSISVSVAARPALCDQSQDLVDRQRQDAQHQIAHRSE